MNRLKSIFYSVFVVSVALVFTQCKTQDVAQETEDQTNLESRIIESDTSTVCEVFTVENPDRAKISQNFADMNLRRQAGDYGPGEFTAFDYWQKVYSEAPGFSILIYTDGSAIYREMAAKAKEEGDTSTFEQYSEKALSLLEKGEECYPETQGKFGPAKAYIYELLYPGRYQTILDLYTEGLNENTDPYSLISIARYAKYMGYIDELEQEEADSLVQEAKDIALAKKGERDFDYAIEQISGIEDQYVEAERQKQEQADAAAAEAESGGSGSDTYDRMMAAVESNNFEEAMTSFKEYLSGVEDAENKYGTAMYIGGKMYEQDQFPMAREAYEIAMEADSTKGDPYYYIGMMYISSGGRCGPGTGFDSQRVLWAGFDKLNEAVEKGLPSDLESTAESTQDQYKEYFPTKAQIQKQGLSEGGTYTVPCWINEETTVRSKESMQ